MWKRISNIVRSHVVVSTVLLSALFISLLGLLGLLLMDLPHTSGMALFTLGQLVLSLAAIWLMRKLQVFDRSDFKLRNMGRGFLLGWFNSVFVVIAFLTVFTQLPANSLVAPQPLDLLVVVLHPFLGTGLFEEVLVRGLVLKLLLLKMGHTKQGIINACIISSVIFGALHMLNLIHTDVLPVMSQMIYATAIGVFYAALFLRTKTLLIPILFHGMVNLSTQIFYAIVSYDVQQEFLQAQNDGGIAAILTNTLVITIPFFSAGLILLRKVKSEENAGQESAAQ